MLRGVTSFAIAISVVLCTGVASFAQDPNSTSASSDGYDFTTVFSRLSNTITSWNNNVRSALTPQSNCKDCGAIIETHEMCTRSNVYLEDEIEKVSGTNPLMRKVLDQPDSADIFRSACIQTALETYGAGLAYRQCGGGQSDARETSRLPKPCVSVGYTDFVSKSFNAAAECLTGYVTGSEKSMNKKISTMAIFSMLNVESGLHINALSPTGAGGPGQFTQPAINDVNSNMPGVLSYLQSSSNPLCNDTLVKALQPPMSSSASKSCERINLSDNNPLKNFLYTFAYQAIAHKKFAGLFMGPPYSDIIAGLPAGEQERFISGIATWSHNTGPAGMEHPLRGLLRTYLQSGKVLKTADDAGEFMKELQQRMQTDPHPANSSQGRRNETYKYYSSILDRSTVIKKHINGDLSKCYNE